jgi:hypothetical protein
MEEVDGIRGSGCVTNPFTPATDAISATDAKRVAADTVRLVRSVLIAPTDVPLLSSRAKRAAAPASRVADVRGS